MTRNRPSSTMITLREAMQSLFEESMLPSGAERGMASNLYETADLAPVTLQLVHRQGNHHPDLLVLCGTVEIWFKNEHGSFIVQ